MKRAPKKLSTAMRLALHDLALVERSKKYKVNMGAWHTKSPFGFMPEPSICHVCFAGSVMAKTLKLDHDSDYSGCEFGDEWPNVFTALDDVRKGHVASAMKQMGRDCDKIPFIYYDSTGYGTDKKQWRKDMWKIVRELEKVGE